MVSLRLREGCTNTAVCDQAEGSMAEEYPVAPARMASLRDKEKNGSSDKEKKGRWFGKNKGRA